MLASILGMLGDAVFLIFNNIISMLPDWSTLPLFTNMSNFSDNVSNTIGGNLIGRVKYFLPYTQMMTTLLVWINGMVIFMGIRYALKIRKDFS